MLRHRCSSHFAGNLLTNSRLPNCEDGANVVGDREIPMKFTIGENHVLENSGPHAFSWRKCRRSKSLRIEEATSEFDCQIVTPVLHLPPESNPLSLSLTVGTGKIAKRPHAMEILPGITIASAVK